MEKITIMYDIKIEIRKTPLLLRRKPYQNKLTNSDFNFLLSVLLERVQNQILWLGVNNGFNGSNNSFNTEKIRFHMKICMPRLECC